MRQFTLITILFLALQIHHANACSPKPDWKPPTPASAFGTAQVIVHARILEQESDESRNTVTAQIQIIRVFKGSFSGNTVTTTDELECGIGKFEIGKEYIFFFKNKDRWFVNDLEQPKNLSTMQILESISKIKI